MLCMDIQYTTSIGKKPYKYICWSNNCIMTKLCIFAIFWYQWLIVVADYFCSTNLMISAMDWCIQQQRNAVCTNFMQKYSHIRGLLLQLLFGWCLIWLAGCNNCSSGIHWQSMVQEKDYSCDNKFYLLYIIVLSCSDWKLEKWLALDGLWKNRENGQQKKDSGHSQQVREF